MSQHSEELRIKVRAALLVRLRRATENLSLGLGENDVNDLADVLSHGVAAAIDAADTEGWLNPGDWGADAEKVHLNHILDALRGQ